MEILAQAPDFDAIEQDVFGGTCTFCGLSRISVFFNLGVISIVFFVAGAGLLLYLISGGLTLMTSKGDPKALEMGKAKVTNALVGFLIVFVSYWIVQIVGYLLGIPDFNPASPGRLFGA